jgi:hypothetical protein
MDDISDEDMIPQHQAVTQLDEWREEVAAIVAKNGGDHENTEQDERKVLRDMYGDEIAELLEELKQEKADLEAAMEGIPPTKDDLDKLEALEDAIIELEDALHP